jgi:hypothetical protein
MICRRNRCQEKERKGNQEIKEIKMNPLTALLIFLILCFPPPASAHHIVFEEIGEMAGALFYIHAIIPVNISGLEGATNTYRSQVASFRQHYSIIQEDIDKRLSPEPDSKSKQTILDSLHYQCHLSKDLLSTAENEADELLDLLMSPRASLPRVNEAPTLVMSDPSSFRIKRGIRAFLLRGIFGTLMGLYNCHKLNSLREQVETVAAHQHCLLQITEVTLHCLNHLEHLMAEMMNLLSEDIDITLAQRKLQVICDQLRLQYQQIVQAIQAAHQQ